MPINSQEDERRAYKDAHANQFAKIRHFPALSHLKTSGENVILLQDCKPVTALVTPRPAVTGQSRVHEPDSFNQLFTDKPMLSEFRATVLCKHTNARKERKEEDVYNVPDKEKKPFVTKSASEARELVKGLRDYDYPTGLHKQSDRVPTWQELTLQKEAKIRGNHKWRNGTANSAKKAIEVKYYMNSPINNQPLDRKAIKEIVATSKQVQRPSPKLTIT
ncbi:hypothetical protein THRCLA_06422 [Thraustotheca clavata]|uniref:Uncharacterized protein n=1 Tax=Thraustotheca clavata TaxID=74557 RepID=A0A1V9ZNV2_9STRA|nr:hypothetical protein THRCLA_06422 [Thraustotheca clavata]